MLQIVPKQNDPIAIEKDLFKRSDYINNILNVYQYCKSSLNIALTGPYGIGKTTLLNMLKNRAVETNFEAIYFNAWEHDYIEDPFASILSALCNLFSFNQDLSKQIMTAGKKLLQIAVPTVVKALTLGAVDLPGNMEETIADITSNFAEYQLNKHLKLKQDIDTFKRELSIAIEEIKKQEKSIIIIIDELDRCKPSYAVKLLECIKHFFHIDHLNFLIGLDYEQLSSSIMHVYGNNIDVKGYLRRFFDYKIDIPAPRLDLFVANLVNEYGIHEKLEKRGKKERKQLENTLIIFLEINRASLRDAEKCINIVNYILSSTPEHYYIFPSIAAYLVVESIFNKNNYNRLTSYLVSYSDVLELYKLNGKIEQITDKYDIFLNTEYFIATLLIAVQPPRPEQTAFQFLSNLLENQNLTDEQRELYKRIYSAMEHYSAGLNAKDIMNYLHKKINFIDSIIIE